MKGCSQHGKHADPSSLGPGRQMLPIGAPDKLRDAGAELASRDRLLTMQLPEQHLAIRSPKRLGINLNPHAPGRPRKAET
jgi:hypothetical protein